MSEGKKAYILQLKFEFCNYDETTSFHDNYKGKFIKNYQSKVNSLEN